MGINCTSSSESEEESDGESDEDEELDVAARLLRFLVRFFGTTCFGAAAGMARK